MAVVFNWGGWVVFPALMFGVIPSVRAAVKLYGRRGADAPPTPASREKQIMRLARANKGRLTAMNVAVDTSFSLAEAEELLDSMTKGGHVRMEVSDDGTILYEFPAFLPRPTTGGGELPGA